MIGNNSCGINSVMAGRTSDNVDELDILTYDGVRMRVGATSDEQLASIILAGGRRGEIYRGLKNLRDRSQTRSGGDIRRFRAVCPATTWMNCCLNAVSMWRGP
jgi:FAD/FMN-containing dehydrogenase